MFYKQLTTPDLRGALLWQPAKVIQGSIGQHFSERSTIGLGDRE